MAKKPPLAPLHKHSTGGCTVDMPPSICYRRLHVVSRAMPYFVGDMACSSAAAMPENNMNCLLDDFHLPPRALYPVKQSSSNQVRAMRYQLSLSASLILVMHKIEICCYT